MQRWPVEKNALLTAHSTATFKSASSSMTSGFLPPISSWNFFIGRDATQAAAIFRPVATEPVKLIAATSGCSSSGCADLGAAADHEIEHALRRARRGAMMSTSAQRRTGTRSAGLITTVLP